ncbi:TonB-dependent siderophore receptor [Chitinophaga japonensis]|uniref:Iron complex outermembrane receptor protein n=1 Tax=Chitinophaga japonensis TaxID=104662 RepID=A0A562SU12_CHIJA|nr:TonB-dependent siderophore receptor [Chitinophaga japonensis]TWI84190.1 iron complex outermembrane receptor protein [Chitinophaga japonensis]
MNKTLLIQVCLCNIVLCGYAQHKNDSLRRQRLQEIVVQEKKRALKADSMAPMLRLQGRLLETPQSIVSISSELIRQQGALVMKDIARNASGVKFGYNSSVFDASTVVMVRGFSSQTFVNGMPQRSAMGGLIDDAAIMERVDFIKGPAGFLLSSGEPGGSMNISTKTPRLQKIRLLEVSGGSFGMLRGAADIGSAIKDKGFSYRLNLAYQQQNSFMDFIKTKKYVAAPVLQYNFSRNTWLLAEYNIIRATADGGSSVAKVGREEEVLKDRIGNNYAGDPGLPQSYTQSQSVRMLLSHRFNERWRLSVQSKYTVTPMEVWYLMSDNYSPVNFDSTNITRRMPVFSNITGRVAAVQAYVNGTFHTGSQVQHNLLAGVDYNYSKDQFANAYGKNTFSFDRTKPQYGLNTDSVRMLNDPLLILRENNWLSFFAYNTTRIRKGWLLNYGGRFTVNTPVTIDPSKPARDETAFSPRLGVTRLLGENTSVYAIYDQSFIPQTGADFEGTPFDPLRGNSIEVGAKREWFQRRLITSLAAYRIIKNNLLVTDLEHRGFRRQIGQATSTGVELDITGRISNRLSVSANYAYTHAITSKDARKENEGARLAFIPEQMINSWLQYTIPLNEISRLSISAGHSTVTRSGTYTRNVYLPGYTKFDAGIAYDAGKWYVRVVADNLTNKRYFSSGDILDVSTGSIYPGVKAYYYTEGEPLSFRTFVGVRL